MKSFAGLKFVRCLAIRNQLAIEILKVNQSAWNQKSESNALWQELDIVTKNEWNIAPPLIRSLQTWHLHYAQAPPRELKVTKNFWISKVSVIK